MDTLRVMEAFHNVFYTPLYVTRNLGFFEQQGLSIEIETIDQARTSVDALSTGEAQIAMTGPMRSFVAADRGDPDVPVSFAEVNSRDGFILLSRRPVRAFRWGDLIGRTVVSYARPPTPWMCLLRVLKEQGVPAGSVDLQTGRLVPDAVAAFRAGTGDYIEAPEPLAEQLISEGSAHLAAMMGPFVGHVPYTSFAASRTYLETHGDVVLRYTRAVHAAQRWMAGHSAGEIAGAIAPSFPDVPHSVLEAGVQRYKAHETWPDNPLLGREGFHRLGEILVEGGLIKRAHAYEDLVTAEFAEAVIRE